MEEEEELGWWCPYSPFPTFQGVEPFPQCPPLHHPTSPLHPRARWWRRRRAWWRRSTSPPAPWSSLTTAPHPPPPILMGQTRESTMPALTQVTWQTRDNAEKGGSGIWSCLCQKLSQMHIAKTGRISNAAAVIVFGCTHFQRSYFSPHYLPALFTANIHAAVVIWLHICCLLLARGLPVLVHRLNFVLVQPVSEQCSDTNCSISGLPQANKTQRKICHLLKRGCCW